MRYLYLLLISIISIPNVLYASDKTLTIGTSHYYPPFVLKGAKRTLSGFDIDLMNQLCIKMNKKCRFQPMAFDKLLPSLSAGRVDIVISALTITSNRKQNFNFSNPYMKSYGRYISLKTNLSVDSNKPIALENMKVGVEHGSVFEEYIKDRLPKSASMHLKEKTYELVELLLDGKLDLLVLDEPSAVWWLINSGKKLQLLGKKFKIGTGLGIATSKTNTSLSTALNKALQTIQAEKGFNSMHDAYFKILDG